MKKVALSVIGQVLLSLFSFGLSVVYISYATQYEFGLFTLYFSVVYLVVGVHNALVCMPLTTLFHNAETLSSRKRVRKASITIRNRLIFCILGLGLLIEILIRTAGSSGPFVLLGVALASSGIMLRDYRRCWSFLCGDAGGALRGDMIFVGIGAILIFGIAKMSTLDATMGLFVIAVAALVGSVISKPSVPDEGDSYADVGEKPYSFIKASSWSLAATINTWMLTGAYLFLVQWHISVEAVAEISAAKLLFVPVGLIASGWSNILRPKAAMHFRSRNIGAMKKDLTLAAVVVFLLVVPYALVVNLGISKAQDFGIMKSYTGLGYLILPWSLYFLFTSFRTLAVCILLSNPKSYSLLFKYSSYAVLTAAIGVSTSLIFESVSGVVWAIAIAELVLLIFSGQYSLKLLLR